MLEESALILVGPDAHAVKSIGLHLEVNDFQMEQPQWLHFDGHRLDACVDLFYPNAKAAERPSIADRVHRAVVVIDVRGENAIKRLIRVAAELSDLFDRNDLHAHTPPNAATLQTWNEFLEGRAAA